MKRSHPQDRDRQPSPFGSRDDARHQFPHSQQMGEPPRAGSQFGSGSDDSRRDWDGGFQDEEEARQFRQMGAGDDRFSGYSGSYEPRGGRREGFSRSNSHSNEDRFAYPESHRPARDLNPRGADTGYSSQGRFGNDWSDRPARYGQGGYGGSTQFREGRFDPTRPYGQDFGASFNSASPEGGGYRSNRVGQRQWSGESVTGGRDEYDGGHDAYAGYGIPAGSEPGGYGFNNPWRRGAQNWSGSNWANDQDWHSRSRSGAFGEASTSARRMPKGYTRSDERIKDDVCERLSRAHDVDVSNVSVEAKGGTVTLEGTVPDRGMKHRIEDLCEQSLGVNDVDNRIRVLRERQQQDDRFDRGSTSTSAPSDRSSPSSAKGVPGSSAGNAH